MAATALAVEELYTSSTPNKPRRLPSITLQSAVSLRATAAVPLPLLGVYITPVTHVVGMGVHSAAAFWRLARSCALAVHDPAQRSHGMQTWGLLRFLPGSWRAFFARRTALPPCGRSSTVELSNLGVVHFPATCLDDDGDVLVDDGSGDSR